MGSRKKKKKKKVKLFKNEQNTQLGGGQLLYQPQFQILPPCNKMQSHGIDRREGAVRKQLKVGHTSLLQILLQVYRSMRTSAQLSASTTSCLANVLR